MVRRLSTGGWLPGAVWGQAVRVDRRDRQRIALELAWRHDGVVHRGDLRAAGITKEHVRAEVEAGRWQLAGRHTLVIDGRQPRGRGLAWRAVWESGSGAVLDGASALQVHGLTGFETSVIDVSVSVNNRWHRVSGVRLHRPRLAVAAQLSGVPRVSVAEAVVNGAHWAVSDRQAALLVVMAVQQRLLTGERLAGYWAEVRRSPRRALLAAVIGDAVDGAHSLGELDVGRLCRRYGLPRPTRQQVRRGHRGAAYLDLYFAEADLAVEIDGSHHHSGFTLVADALRQNAVAIEATTVLRIPLLGLRIAEAEFMSQLVEAHTRGRARRAS